MKKVLLKGVIIFTLVFALTSFGGYQKAFAFDVWQVITTVISSVYDGIGRLIGQKGINTSNGVDLDGNKVSSTLESTYQILNGRALLKTMTSTSTSTAIDNDVDDDGTDENLAYNYVEQTVDYAHDGIGLLTGAAGTEIMDGQEASYYTDKQAFLNAGGVEGDIVKDVGEYDLDGDGTIEDNEKDVVIAKGGKYNGNAASNFIVLLGEAVTTNRTGNYTFENNDGSEKFTRISDSLSKYSIINGLVLLKENISDQKDTLKQTYIYKDEEGTSHDDGTNLFRAQHIQTIYDYTPGGALNVVHTGEGANGENKSCGWGLVLTGNGYVVYASNLNITYRIVNGVARQGTYTEVASQASAAEGIEGNDPSGTGTVIGKFDVVSDYTPTEDDVHGTNANAGAHNHFTYLIVQASDGSVYLLQALTETGDPNMTAIDVSGFNVGDRVSFVGDSRKPTDADPNAPDRLWKLTSVSKI